MNPQQFKLFLGYCWGEKKPQEKHTNKKTPNLTVKVLKGAHSKKSCSVLSYIHGIAVSNIFKCIHFNRISNILYKR